MKASDSIFNAREMDNARACNVMLSALLLSLMLLQVPVLLLLLPLPPALFPASATTSAYSIVSLKKEKYPASVNPQKYSPVGANMVAQRQREIQKRTPE